MKDKEKARELFLEAGLAFPAIPTELAEKLREREKWVFATRELSMSPYNLRVYAEEAENSRLEDYAVLAHSGHGVNSYAVQYYLVHGALRIFLHLAWGGVYMKHDTQACNRNRHLQHEGLSAILVETARHQRFGPIRLAQGPVFAGPGRDRSV